MANVKYQYKQPATPPNNTTIKTTTVDGAEVQHVNIDTIAAGNNNIGNVDIASSIPAGTNNIGDVDIFGITVAARPISGQNTIPVSTGHSDSIGDIPVVMDYGHHQIHEGEKWHWDILISNLASGSSYDIVFTVPNITITSNAVTQCPHLEYDINANDLCSFFLYEGPTVTAATGTARTPINFERNGTYTPLLTILDAPTVTATGTQIDAEYFLAAATNQNKPTSRGGSPAEFVLKNNTKYLFRATSGATGCDIHIDFVWYEDHGT